MRRKKDNKRVLRPGNGSSTRKGRKNNRFKSKNKGFKSKMARNPAPHIKQKKKRRSNGKLVLIMIIALIAFIIGAGFGISLSFDDNSTDAENATQFENVTDQMLSNVSVSDSSNFNSADSPVSNGNQSGNRLNHSGNSNK